MGILSSKYRFVLNGQDWCVAMRYRSGRYHYLITIDEQTMVDTRPDQTLEEILEPQSFSFMLG
ncbi:MAG: hypothetical protein ACSHX3_09205 [Litorimonas sp.]